MSDKDTIYRQDAIDAMCSACGYDCDEREFVYNAPQDEQVIMCPEHYALSTLPSAEQCMTATSNTMVSDTVKIPVMDGTTERLPSAEPEIIRCKDCRHRDSNDCPMHYEEWIEIDEGDGYFDTDTIIHDWTTDEGFCHCAESRGKEE